MEFDSILDAINYRVRCPLCSHLLDTSIDNPIINNNLIFYLDNKPDKVLININTQITKIDSEQKYFGGQSYFYFLKECRDCTCYWFGIQIVIDIMNSICYVVKIILGTEYFLIDDENKNLHDIHNKHSINETHRYIQYKDGKKSSLQKLPLIKFNNAKDFLDKIDKISIFS